MSEHSETDKTHFGYKKVNSEAKEDLVRQVFTSVASRYDLMNDLMSFGIHRIWKRVALNMLGIQAGDVILDVAGGTGDLTVKISDIVGESGRVILTDINNAMLSRGRDRLLDVGKIKNTDFVQANAENLPFLDNSFDSVAISFGLRNVTDKDRALRSMHRVLKPGAKLLILEFSHVENPAIQKLYDWYSFSVLPVLGEWVVDDCESYQYLAESIRMHPGQEELQGMMQSAGFVNVAYHNLTGGIVAVHIGSKA